MNPSPQKKFNKKILGILLTIVIVAGATKIALSQGIIGDLDNDGDIDTLDFGVFVTSFPAINLDLNGDGQTNIFDFNLLVENFGTTELAEVVQPASRDTSRWGAARCNDGTPFAFEVKRSPVGSSDWVVYLEGGGFCDDQANLCPPRTGYLTTTLTDPTTSLAYADGARVAFQKTAGIFSSDSTENPTFHQANWVFAHYCSSDVWSGNRSQTRPLISDPNQQWYFSGKHNVQAMLEVLKEQYSLDDGNPETTVLFLGESAGGGGVMANAENAKSLLPETVSRNGLKLVNDAGYIPEYDNPNYRPGEASVATLQIALDAYEFWGSSLNAQCETLYPQEKGRCLMLKYVYPTLVNQANQTPPGLGLPLLIQTSSIDEFTLKLHHILDDFGNLIAPPEIMEEWRNVVLEELEPPLPEVGWLFSNGDHSYHTITTNSTTDTGWNMAPAGQPENSYKNLLTRFWNGQPEEHLVFGNPDNPEGDQSTPFGMRFPPVDKICNYPFVTFWRGDLLDANNNLQTTLLDTARACGTKVLVRLHGETSDITGPNGVGLDLAKYEDRINDFAGLIDNYVADGTIFAHLTVDEPHDCTNDWGGNCPEPNQIEQTAEISDQYWPGLATYTNTSASYASQITWEQIDFINFQYAYHKGDLTTYINDALAVLQNGNIPEISWSFQAAHGGCSVYTPGCNMTPEQVTTVGTAMCNSQTGHFVSFSSYRDDLMTPEMEAAISTVRAACNS